MCSNINLSCVKRMNIRRNIVQRRRGAAAGNNQVPPQAPAEGVAMPVNPAGLTDAEVRASLSQMVQAIALQAQAMTAQVNRQNVQRENPLVRSMAQGCCTNLVQDVAG